MEYCKMNDDNKLIKDFTDKELMEVWKDLKPMAKKLGKEEYKYLIEIEKEMNKRGL